jgi:hypothetical protein
MTSEEEACLHALFLTDPVYDKDALKRRKGEHASGTCEWILETEELLTWLGEMEMDIQFHSNVFWLYGNPGTGKSVIALTIAEMLPKMNLFSKGQKMLAYFFCESSSEDRATAIGILRGLLYQLMKQQPRLLRFILSEYTYKKEELFRSFDCLWSIFMDVVNDPVTGTKYIIIDALDECDLASQKALLKKFAQFIRPSVSGYLTSNLRILVTSRPYPEIQEYLDQFSHRDLSSFTESKKDIDIFISERVAELKARKRYTKKISD